MTEAEKNKAYKRLRFLVDECRIADGAEPGCPLYAELKQIVNKLPKKWLEDKVRANEKNDRG